MDEIRCVNYENNFISVICCFNSIYMQIKQGPEQSVVVLNKEKIKKLRKQLKKCLKHIEENEVQS